MKLFELFESKQQLTEAKILSESIKLATAIIKLLEADDFEWEPQPEFKGVKGVTTATGAGEKAARAGTQTKAAQQLNTVWKKLIMQAKRVDRESKKALVPHLQKIAKLAQGRGITLDPNPQSILGLQSASAVA